MCLTAHSPLKYMYNAQLFRMCYEQHIGYLALFNGELYQGRKMWVTPGWKKKKSRTAFFSLQFPRQLRGHKHRNDAAGEGKKMNE